MQLETALHILGIEDLRPFQKEALNTLLTGRNLLTLMPTSAGKSLIFTSFAMVQERLTKDGASALKTDPDGGKADKVDAISKATVSSNAIKEAVLDALKD